MIKGLLSLVLVTVLCVSAYGVVEYSSAHLDGMASELIVKSGHSSQLNPLAIDEVRRILVENLAASSPDRW